MIYIAVFLLCALEVANGLPYVDVCPKVEPIKNFDLQKFSGVWYEVERSWWGRNLTTRCHKETYDAVGGNELHITAEFISKRTNQSEVSTGTARQYDPQFPGEMRYIFGGMREEGTLYVLNTDYENFAVLYTCDATGFLTLETVWIVTRSRPTSPEVTLPDDIRNYVGGNYFFIPIDQYNCDDTDDTSTE